jgi:heme A synthase
VPSVLVIFVLVSVMAKSYAAIPAALIVLGFVGWLTVATWSELTSRGRNLRIAFLVVIALVLAYQCLRVV